MKRTKAIDVYVDTESLKDYLSGADLHGLVILAKEEMEENSDKHFTKAVITVVAPELKRSLSEYDIEKAFDESMRDINPETRMIDTMKKLLGF